MLNTSTFTVINESFTCENCYQEVPPLDKGCRNHCPFCLHSKHVDEKPGDRANDCEGLLKPISYYLHKKKGIMIEFRCQKCQGTSLNKASIEDSQAPDNYNLLLKLNQIQP